MIIVRVRTAPCSTLFPYTTLFRSVERDRLRRVVLSDVIAAPRPFVDVIAERSEEHTSELQSRLQLVCRLLLEKKKARVQSATWSKLIASLGARSAHATRKRRREAK